jgi:hypothetical protein
MLSQGVTHEPEPYISISDIPPFNFPDFRRLSMVIKAYYDGSGKASADSVALTLGGFSGTQRAWELFGPKWAAILRRGGIKHWHTTDAMTCSKDFDRLDWDADKAVATLDSIIELICEVSSYKLAPEERLCGHVATVFLDDYRHLKGQSNRYLRRPEDICINGAVGPAINNTQYSTLLIYFDQNERLQPVFHRVWQKGRAKAKTIQREWALKVETICELDSRKYYELQLADALAWIVNKNHVLRMTGAPQELGTSASNRVLKILLACMPDYAIFDHAQMIRAFPADAEKYRHYTHAMAFGTEKDRAALQAQDPQSFAEWLDIRSPRNPNG